MTSAAPAAATRGAARERRQAQCGPLCSRQRLGLERVQVHTTKVGPGQNVPVDAEGAAPQRPQWIFALLESAFVEGTARRLSPKLKRTTTSDRLKLCLSYGDRQQRVPFSNRLGLSMLFAVFLAIGLPRIQEPPPPLPPMPGNPPPIARGDGRLGHLGGDCQDRLSDDGRWFRTSWTSIASGERIWLSITSPDFDAVLEVLDPAGQVVARIEDIKGGPETGAYLTAAGRPSPEHNSAEYRYRITSAGPGQTGRWRLEDRRDGGNTRMFSDQMIYPAPTGRCVGGPCPEPPGVGESCAVAHADTHP